MTPADLRRADALLDRLMKCDRLLRLPRESAALRVPCFRDLGHTSCEDVMLDDAIWREAVRSLRRELVAELTALGIEVP